MLLRAAAIVLVCVSWAAGQTSISLRSSVQLVEGRQDLRLADVADVSGPDAATLGALTVATDLPRTAGRDGVVPLTLAQVRTALEGQPGVNLGKITMRGGTCMVRAAGRPTAEPAQPVAPGRTDRRSEPAPIDMTGPATLRTTIAERLAAEHGVAVADLRVGFDDTDEPTLARLIGESRVNVHLGGAGASARLPITLTVYEADPARPGDMRIALSRTVQADVLVRRAVPVAADAIDRGQVIGHEQITTDTRWVSPARGGLMEPEQPAGLVAQRRIAAGQLISASDVAAPQACKRGDTVYVHCLSGGVIVKVRAKALESARDGEPVLLKIDGSEQPFQARMSGKGRAVMEVK